METGTHLSPSRVKAVRLGDLVLGILSHVPPVAPCAFIDREMHAMLLAHCLGSIQGNSFPRVRNLGLAATSCRMAVWAENAESVVRHEDVSPGTLARQLVIYG